MGRLSTAEKPQKREADTKQAQSRVSMVELAKELGNVAEACLQQGLNCLASAPMGQIVVIDEQRISGSS